VRNFGPAKVCRRLNIPRPKHGYWLRRSIGQDPPNRALPAAGPDTPQTWEGERRVAPAPGGEAPAMPPRDSTLDRPIPVPDRPDSSPSPPPPQRPT